MVAVVAVVAVVVVEAVVEAVLSVPCVRRVVVGVALGEDDEGGGIGRRISNADKRIVMSSALSAIKLRWYPTTIWITCTNWSQMAVCRSS